MPKLPTYSANIQAGAISGGRRAGPEDTGVVDLIPTVRAVQQAGDQLTDQIVTQREREQREMERLRREQEAKAGRDAALRGAKVVAFGRNQFVDYINQASQKPMEVLPDVVADFNEKFEDFRNKALEQEEHPEGRQRLEIDLEQMRGGLIDNAMRLQAQRAGIAASSSMRDVFSQNAIVVQKDPTQLEALIGQERKLIADLNIPGLTDAQRERLYEDRRHVLPGAAIGARIAAVQNSRQATALKQELEGNKRWQELLSGEQYARAMNDLTKDIRNFQKAERAAYVEQVRERINEAAAGIPNGLSAREAGGDPKLARAISGALAIGKARQDIKSLPANEVAVIVQKALTQLATPGDYTQDRAYAEAVLAADNERRRALAQDSAGYAIQNVTPVKQAYEAMVNSQFDPKAVSRYAAVSAEAQRDLGGPGFSARLLPKSQVDQVLAEVGSLPPEQVANRMESLQKQYGPLWGEILSQMGGKLPPGYSTLGRLSAPTDYLTRTTLADALKAGPDLRKNLLETDAKDVDRRVEEAMLPYSRIVSQAGAPAQIVLREETAAAKALAYQMVARGQSPNEAAKNAANALIFDRYDTGETFLAPKGMLGQAQREAARLMRETPVDAFPKAAGGDAALSDQYRREANKREAERGFWANVTDTASGKLGIEWRNSDGTPVVLDSGERVRLFFDDLRNLPPPPRRGALPRGTSATQGGAAARAP